MMRTARVRPNSLAAGRIDIINPSLPVPVVFFSPGQREDNMATKVRWIARRMPRCLLLALTAALFSTPVLPARDAENPLPSATAHADYPQVRLRKLHLVRPDLIPYPVEYDVYC